MSKPVHLTCPSCGAVTPLPDGAATGTVVCAECQALMDFDLREAQTSSAVSASVDAGQLMARLADQDLDRPAKLDALAQYVTAHGSLRGPAEALWAEVSKIEWVHGRSEWPLPDRGAVATGPAGADPLVGLGAGRAPEGGASGA